MVWRVKAVGSIDRHKVRVWAVPLVLFSSFLTLYLSTLTHYYTYDSVAYATQIRKFVEEGRAGWLFHPHHLLFNPLGYLIWRLLQFIGLNIDPLTSLQYMNAFFASLGLVLFYILLRKGGFRVGGSNSAGGGTSLLISASATVILGLTFGYWECAVDGRVNMPGLAAVILALGLAWGMLDSPGVKQSLAAAGATVLAVALHQSHGLLIVPVVGAIMLSGLAWRSRLSLGALYLGATFTGIAALYIGIAVPFKGVHTYSAFNAWVLAYARDGRWWNFSIKQNLMADVTGLAHVFSAKQIDYDVFRGWGRYLPMATAAAVVALGLCCTRFPRSMTRLFYDTTERRALVLIMAAVPYAAFFTVWVPGYFAFWVPVGLMVILGAVILIGSVEDRLKWTTLVGLAAVLITLAYLNAPTLLRNIQRSHNPDLVLCDSLRNHTRPGDMVIITGTYAPDVMPATYAETYLPYFLRVSVKTVNGECKLFGGDTSHALRSIRGVTRMRLDAGHQVFILSEFQNDKTWHALTKRWNLPDGSREMILKGYKLQPIRSGGRVVAYSVTTRINDNKDYFFVDDAELSVGQ